MNIQQSIITFIFWRSFWRRTQGEAVWVMTGPPRTVRLSNLGKGAISNSLRRPFAIWSTWSARGIIGWRDFSHLKRRKFSKQLAWGRNNLKKNFAIKPLFYTIHFQKSRNCKEQCGREGAIVLENFTGYFYSSAFGLEMASLVYFTTPYILTK